MNILALNRGSSSVKCCIYAFLRSPDRLENPVWETKIEWKNIAKEGSSKIRGDLHSLLLSGKEIDCIGHRIVHGGNEYRESVFIDANVKKEIRKLADLAPLHNLADLEGIEILEKMFPGKPQIAVFDTAFHHTLPESAKIYPGPCEWVQMGIQRYGFHGTSFQYCARRASEILGQTPHRMVICHLGSGALGRPHDGYPLGQRRSRHSLVSFGKKRENGPRTICRIVRKIRVVGPFWNIERYARYFDKGV